MQGRPAEVLDRPRGSAVIRAQLADELASDFVESLVGELGDVEMVVGDLRVGQDLGHRLGVRRGHVHRHDRDAGASFGAEHREEALEHVTALAFGDPNHPSPVVIGDDRQVAMVLAEADLVDRDAAQVLQPGGIEQLRHHALRDAAHGDPRDATQLRNGGLVRSLSQQADGVLEGSREVAAVACPGHVLSDHAPARATAQAADLALDPRRTPPHAEMPPSPDAGRHPPALPVPTARTGQPPEAALDGHHELPVVEADAGDPEPLEVEQLVE